MFYNLRRYIRCWQRTRALVRYDTLWQIQPVDEIMLSGLFNAAWGFGRGFYHREPIANERGVMHLPFTLYVRERAQLDQFIEAYANELGMTDWREMPPCKYHTELLRLYDLRQVEPMVQVCRKYGERNHNITHRSNGHAEI